MTKKMGRPKKYVGDGAPKITIRFSPDVYDWLKTRDEGARACIEALVRQEMAKTKQSAI